MTKDLTRRRGGNNGVTEGFLLSQQALVNLDNEVESSGNVVAMTNTKPSGDKFAQCLGASGDYFSTPDSVAASITGDIDIRVRVALDDWTPASNTALVAKYEASPQYSYLFECLTSGVLRIQISANGTSNAVAASSTVATGFANGSTNWVRFTLDVDNGAAGNDTKFYTSSDGVTWTQLGTTITSASTTSIYDGTSIVEIGSVLGGTIERVNGSIYRAQIFDTIDGTTPVVDFNPNDYANTGNDNWASSSTGEIWTIQGNNYVVTPRAMVGTGKPWAALPGASGDYFSTPDSVANSITGDIDIRSRIVFDDYTPTALQYVLSKLLSSGQHAYDHAINTTGRPQFRTSSNGTSVNVFNADAAVPFSNGELGWLRVTLDVDNGSGDADCTFYTSTDDVNSSEEVTTWTQLGSVISLGSTTSIFGGTDPLEVGGRSPSDPMAGKLYRCQIYNGIDGTKVVDFDPIMHTNGSTLYGRTGELWTANGNAAIHGYDVNVVVGTGANLRKSISDAMLAYGANGDYASTPNSAAQTPSGDFSAIVRMAMDDWTPAGDVVIASKFGAAGTYSYLFRNAGASGLIQFFTSNDGTALKTFNSTVAPTVSDGDALWIKAEVDVDNGASGTTVTFSTSTDGDVAIDSVTWTQLGDPVIVAGVTTLFDSSESLTLMNWTSGANAIAGDLYRFALYDGSTLAVDFNAADYVNRTSDTQFPSSTTGEVWTLNGNTFIQNTGHEVVHSIGSAGLESTSGITVASPGTVFAVARFSDASPVADQNIFNGRSDVSLRWVITSFNSSSDKFSIFQGGSIQTITEAYDLDSHVFTGQFSGDATTKLTVSDRGFVIGDAGSAAFDYGTVFASHTGSNTMQGYIGRLIVFDRALSEAEVLAVQSYLQSAYNL
tara:strand:+ start:14751 stop:17417 length:2667 start_codon:yes stop_codon:yes gene_type:complete